MTNKRPLKSYIRYDGSGRAVSSSLIWRKNKPKVGNWKEVQGYECCNSGGGTFTTQIEFGPSGDGVNAGTGFNFQCDETLVLFYPVYYPPGTNTVEEIVDYLNSTVSNLATFTVVNSNTISITISSVITNTLCPSGTLLIYPTLPV